MTKTKTKDKAAKKVTPRDRNAGMSPQSERYEKRESGFYLIKTTASGVQTETPLSNFIAEIITEIHRPHPYTGKMVIEGLVVEVHYKDWVKMEKIPATGLQEIFDRRLLDACLSVHPMASVSPNKTAQVLYAIKELSNPRIFVKESENGGKTSIPQTRR